MTYTLTNQYGSNGNLTSSRWNDVNGVEVTAAVALQGLANLETIIGALDSTMATLTTIIDAAAVPATVTTFPQAQTAVRQLQSAVGALALNQRRLIRFLRGNLTGTT